MGSGTGLAEPPQLRGAELARAAKQDRRAGVGVLLGSAGMRRARGRGCIYCSLSRWSRTTRQHKLPFTPDALPQPKGPGYMRRGMLRARPSLGARAAGPCRAVVTMHRAGRGQQPVTRARGEKGQLRGCRMAGGLRTLTGWLKGFGSEGLM